MSQNQAHHPSITMGSFSYPSCTKLLSKLLGSSCMSWQIQLMGNEVTQQKMESRFWWTSMFVLRLQSVRKEMEGKKWLGEKCQSCLKYYCNLKPQLDYSLRQCKHSFPAVCMTRVGVGLNLMIEVNGQQKVFTVDLVPSFKVKVPPTFDELQLRQVQ